jgi:hypothetical protein
LSTQKRKTVLQGFLSAQDISKTEIQDADVAEYWKKVKNNFFVLVDTEKDKVVFLNRELKDIAKKYEGSTIRITIEPITTHEIAEHKLPDMENEYQGVEKFKRTIFSIFKIS